MSTRKDKILEANRYDERANKRNACLVGFKESLPIYLRQPYDHYEKCITEIISPDDTVLELGAGSGAHTLCLLRTGANVILNDISGNSLTLLASSAAKLGYKTTCLLADMEHIPISDGSVDTVVCAGSLSYGQKDIVISEIVRVLKAGGNFISVDSLNDNVIYRFNRWLHFLRGNRTKSTLINMPDSKYLRTISNYFNEFEVFYYGGISFLMPFVSICCGNEVAAGISDRFDKVFEIKKMAFKYVCIARNVRK